MNGRLAVGWVLGIAAQLSAIGLLLTAGWLISRAAEQPPVLYLMVAIVGVRAFGIARGVLRYAERLLTHDAAFRMLTDERVSAYKSLERAAPAGLSGERRGDLVSRVVSDVDALQDRQLRVRLPLTINLAAEIVVIAMVAWVHLPAGIALTAIVVVLQAGLPKLVARAGGFEQREVATLRGAMATELAQAVDAAPDLIAYGATHLVHDRLREADGALVRAQRKAAWLNGMGSSIVLVGVGAGVCLLGWFATAAVAQGSLKPVLLAVIVLAPIALLEPLDGIPVIEQHRQRVRSSVERVRALSELRSPVTEAGDPALMPGRFDLEVRGLAVGWNGAVAAAGIEFDLAEGGVLVIGGRSGRGKSTLAATLLKLIPPIDGSIRLGGFGLERIDGSAVRSRIGLLQQDGHIFATTIRENLRIAKPDASAADLDRALERAGLTEFVSTLPRGLDTEVGEHGGRLSGGERQRLGLARLLLADHRVLVLDEPTEHLDRATAERLIDDILALAPERSIIVITHAAWVRDRVGRSLSLDLRPTC